MLVSYIYYRFKQVQSVDHNESLDNPSKLQAIRTAFNEAKTLYKGESRVPFKKSKIGGRFGLFAVLDYRKIPNTAVATEKNLAACTTSKKAQKQIVQLLQMDGSLWDLDKGLNHAFNNYLLTCLRYQHIDAYRDIVGKAYGVTFVSNEITLYRRDSRIPFTIFEIGFELESLTNTFSTRKLNYAKTATLSYGVSFSKNIPPTCYGFGSPYYYHVYFPPKHNFLLIDIVNSPRNQEKLSPSLIALAEVNSLDDIPAACVKACIEEGIFAQRENYNFNPQTALTHRARKPRGCY